MGREPTWTAWGGWQLFRMRSLVPACRLLKRNQKRSLSSLMFFAYRSYLERDTRGLRHTGLELLPLRQMQVNLCCRKSICFEVD